MSTRDKLIERLLSKPKDFSYDEVKRLFTKFGYIEDCKGRTSGSRGAFSHPDTKAVYNFHRPHSGNFKTYQIIEIINFLKENNHIN